MTDDKTDTVKDVAAGLGARIVKVREHLGLNQKQFAGTLDLYPNHLSTIETGQRSPNMNFFHKLGAVHHASLDYIFFGDGDMFRGPTPESTDEPSLLLSLETFDDFVRLLKQSRMFRGAMLSYACQYLTENYDITKKHLMMEKKEREERAAPPIPRRDEP